MRLVFGWALLGLEHHLNSLRHVITQLLNIFLWYRPLPVLHLLLPSKMDAPHQITGLASATTELNLRGWGRMIMHKYSDLILRGICPIPSGVPQHRLHRQKFLKKICKSLKTTLHAILAVCEPKFGGGELIVACITRPPSRPQNANELYRLNIDSINWLAQSPDFNPIENL